VQADILANCFFTRRYTCTHERHRHCGTTEQTDKKLI
jgi:hypothetical protein